MKKLIKNSFYLYVLLIFCSFLCTPKADSLGTKVNAFSKFDVTATELEIEEYQKFEHGLMASTIEFETNDTDLKEADTIPSKNYTIVIDAGHGGPDPGSIGYKTKVLESDLNLKISKMLKSKLEESGINVILTRSSDSALAEGRGKAFKKRDMELRRDIIKETRPNMVISIHQNSYTNHSLRGAQVFYDKTSEISKTIAECIQTSFKSSLDHANKCTSPGDYYMLKCSAAPSVIVECGFLSNAEEEQLLLSSAYQQKIVDSIFFGIMNFLQNK